jgi:hypothetical protein
MIKWIKNNWTDPVWSKVIADIIKTTIYTIAGFIFLGIISIFKSGTFFGISKQILVYEIPIWEIFVIVVIIFLIYSIIWRKRNYVNTVTSDYKILLDLNYVGEHDIIDERLKHDNSVNEAAGNYKIENGMLNITRTNNEGRFLIRFERYSIDGQNVSCIRNNPTLESDRRLLVSFKAKITNGSHTFRVICRKYNIAQWVHNAFVTFKIQSKEFQQYKRIIYVPANEDFQLQVDDLDVQNVSSSIQVKDFTIIELIS